MKLLIVCASVAFALGAGGCTSGDSGIPATPPFDPFGGEPAPTTGSEPTGGDNEAPAGGGSLTEVCARACAHIASSCPNSVGGATCPSDCASSVDNIPNCAAQFKTWVACIATAPLDCLDGNIAAPSCDAAQQAISACAGQVTPAST